MIMGRNFVVVGIGTEVGKTVISAILTESLKAFYWKPVQSGDLHYTDSHKVGSLAPSNKGILKELFQLKTPASPHYSALIDGVKIEKNIFQLPKLEEDSNLIIEAAGGLMVPLNSEGLLYVDVIQEWNLPVVLVSRHYLGSINHTLLSLELLKQKEISVHFIVFVGDETLSTEEIIQFKYPTIKSIRVPFSENLDIDFIQQQAKRFVEVGF